MATRHIFGAVVTVALAAGTAMAQEATTVACANAGVQYKIGEYACIAACHGQRRLARCDAVAERASWTYVSDACPSAMIINPPWPTDWTEVPAASLMTPIPLTVNLSAIAPEIAPAITRLRVSLVR
ncbi:MAG: hypothetical protein WD036_06950 [Bauldia sp.]